MNALNRIFIALACFFITLSCKEDKKVTYSSLETEVVPSEIILLFTHYKIVLYSGKTYRSMILNVHCH
ncbi:hypothetical protein LV92_02637 [Arenibacter echinorum]|uniref:Uncharacterized protein n=1 Tax=Arenibacter echinorum TaxID=440515 RepID=A0A327R636_9FLAO|nr:hypothetical protein LV92_02637 [Arenibacter echinorum]